MVVVVVVVEVVEVAAIVYVRGGVGGGRRDLNLPLTRSQI